MAGERERPSAERMFETAREEYFRLHDVYAGLSGDFLKIKTWAVGLSGLGFVGAVTWKPNLFAFALVFALSVIFWSLETLWKLFQHGHLTRLKTLQYEFRAYYAGRPAFSSPRINPTWQRTYDWDRKHRRLTYALYAHTWLPYLPICCIAAGCGVWWAEGWDGGTWVPRTVASMLAAVLPALLAYVASRIVTSREHKDPGPPLVRHIPDAGECLDEEEKPDPDPREA